MSRQRIFVRNGPPLQSGRASGSRTRAAPTALVILGIDNLGALEDLFGESLGEEIVAAV